MRKFFKWLGIVLGGLLGLVLLLMVVFYVNGTLRLAKRYTVPEAALTIPTDAASIARGEHWVTSGVCEYCHGTDLGGTALASDPVLGEIAAPNLTPGEGGAGSQLTDADWVRAIRYGVGPNGRGLVIMPSNHFYYFSDRDLGDVIAYLKTLPPVDREWPEPRVAPFGKILEGAGLMGNFIAAGAIDFGAARPASPVEGVTAEYGDYLTRVSGCRMCHGEYLTGDPRPPNPSAPPVPALDAASEVAYWTEEQFISTIRTGTAPSGHVLSKFMPWAELRNMSDDQLKAVWLYLQSLAAE